MLKPNYAPCAQLCLPIPPSPCAQLCPPIPPSSGVLLQGLATTLQHRMAVALAVLSHTDSTAAASNVLAQLETRSTVNVLADLQRQGALNDHDAKALLNTAPLPVVPAGLSAHHDSDLWWAAQTLRHLLDACALLRAHESVALSPYHSEGQTGSQQPTGQGLVQAARATTASLLAGLQAASTRRQLLVLALRQSAEALDDALARVQQAALRGWLVRAALVVITHNSEVTAHSVPEAVLMSAASARRLEDDGDAVGDADVDQNVDQNDDQDCKEPVLWFFREVVSNLRAALPKQGAATALVLDEWSFRLGLTNTLLPYTNEPFPTSAHWRCGWRGLCGVESPPFCHSWTPLLAHLQTDPNTLLQQCMAQGQHAAAVAARHTLPGAEQAYATDWLVDQLQDTRVDQSVDQGDELRRIDVAACPHPLPSGLLQMALFIDVVMVKPMPAAHASRLLHQALQIAVRVTQCMKTCVWVSERHCLNF